MGQELLNVVTIVGTRPEIIRLSRVISRLNDSKSIKHTLIHTGQNYDYELNQIFFDDLEIQKPDHFLNCGKKSKSACDTIGQIISRVDNVLEKESPDAVLVLGDTNSCLSVIPAKRRKIPIFHMEAGNRCFDFRVLDPHVLAGKEAGTGYIIHVTASPEDNGQSDSVYAQKARR